MITCFNRDKLGRCLAYKDTDCHPECKARISTPKAKVELVQCLLSRVNSRKDRKKLEEELGDALRVQAACEQEQYEGWMSCYLAEMARGKKGGASEGDTNRCNKTLLKDNRPPETKLNSVEAEELKMELAKWEEENGKLERLGRSSMTRSKIDSYTQYPICFNDNGIGTCDGIVSASNRMAKSCKECEHLKEGAR